MPRVSHACHRRARPVGRPPRGRRPRARPRRAIPDKLSGAAPRDHRSNSPDSRPSPALVPKATTKPRGVAAIPSGAEQSRTDRRGRRLVWPQTSRVIDGGVPLAARSDTGWLLQVRAGQLGAGRCRIRQEAATAAPPQRGYPSSRKAKARRSHRVASYRRVKPARWTPNSNRPTGVSPFSQATSRADPPRLRADLRRDWAHQRRGSRGPPPRPRSLATYRVGRAPRPTS